MKSLKLIIGILSIVLALFIMFQSCTVNVSNALESSDDISGSAGTLVAFVYLIAGISGIIVRGSKPGCIVTGIIYFLGGLLGISNQGKFADLIVWSVLAFIFGAVFFLSAFGIKKEAKKG